MSFPFRDTSPEAQREISLARLLAFVRDVVSPYSPYYRRVLRERGVDVAGLRTYEDFRRAIPITTKADIVAHQAAFTVAPAYPGHPNPHGVEPLRPAHWAAYRAAAQTPGVRDVFGLRPEQDRIREQYLREWQPIHFQMSGGSTGRSITTGYTYRDLDLMARSAAWWYELNRRIRPDDKWLNLLPAAPHLGIYAGLLVPLLTAQPNFNTFGGKAMPTERQIELAAEDGNFAAIIALPSYLTHWLRTAGRMLDSGRIKPLAGFRLTFCVGEPITDSYRRLLKDLFRAVGAEDVAVLEGMGSTELRSPGFYECAEGSKLHFDPEYFFAEILHPQTREPVPWGEPGVLVWSHIDWRGTVILRYWTGDYISGGMVWGTCPHCRLTIPRLVTPIWRAERDFTRIRGARVEYVALQDAVRGVAGVQTYQIVIGTDDPAEAASRDRLDVTVAAAPGSDTVVLANAVRDAVKRQVEVLPDSVTVEPAADIEARLFARKLKAEWIVDLRPPPAVAPDGAAT